MKAPEKIYLYPSDRAGEEYEDEWGTIPWGEGNVEYTRSDASIKHTCELLNKMICEVTYKDLQGDSTQHYDKNEFIEDFRHYMEDWHGKEG